MKRKKSILDYVDLIAFIVLVIMIFVLFAHDINMRDERKEISSVQVVNEIYTADVLQLAYETQELSVQLKEASKYVVYEMTPEDIAEEEYFDSLELLAICVEAEAGNQDLMGKRLVADVILNRVDSPDFPDDIVSVITQQNQFSSYSDGHMDAVWEPSDETFEAVQMELAYRSNPYVLYFTEGKYNPYCEPGFIHGAHYFGY